MIRNVFISTDSPFSGQHAKTTTDAAILNLKKSAIAANRSIFFKKFLCSVTQTKADTNCLRVYYGVLIEEILF